MRQRSKGCIRIKRPRWLVGLAADHDEFISEATASGWLQEQDARDAQRERAWIRARLGLPREHSPRSAAGLEPWPERPPQPADERGGADDDRTTHRAPHRASQLANLAFIPPTEQRRGSATLGDAGQCDQCGGLQRAAIEWEDDRAVEVLSCINGHTLYGKQPAATDDDEVARLEAAEAWALQQWRKLRDEIETTRPDFSQWRPERRRPTRTDRKLPAVVRARRWTLRPRSREAAAAYKHYAALTQRAEDVAKIILSLRDRIDAEQNGHDLPRPRPPAGLRVPSPQPFGSSWNNYKPALSRDERWQYYGRAGDPTPWLSLVGLGGGGWAARMIEDTEEFDPGRRRSRTSVGTADLLPLPPVVGPLVCGPCREASLSLLSCIHTFDPRS